MEFLKIAISYVFYCLIDFFSGAHFFQKLKFLEKMQYSSRKDIESLQYEYLRSLINDAYVNTAFYKNKYEKAKVNPNFLVSLSGLSKFPVVTKKEIRGEYKKMINKRFDIEKLKHTQSSGSTGEPKIFYFDSETYGWRLATTYLGWKRSGFRFGHKWLRISMAERKTAFYKVFNFFSRCIYFSLTDFNEDKLEIIRKTLEKEKPEMVYSYCSALYVLADYLDKHGYKYDFIRSIIVQGDMLFPKYRKTIEKVFQTKVFDTYGGDGIVISGQCNKGNYHVQDLGVIIEIVDDKYRPVKDGELGKILVTDLHNHAMPLIRYEIADLGIKKGGKCKCGSCFSMMEPPIGRDTDIIKLSNGMSLLVEYFVVVFEYYLEILQFQVREVAQDKLLIYLKVTKDFNDRIKMKLVNQIKNYCNGGIEIEVKIVDEIPLGRSNKRRFIISRG